MTISLTKTTISDLSTLYEFQLDKEGNHLAAFTSKESGDKEAYLKKYGSFLNNPTINMQTIKYDDVIVGSISKFIMGDKAEITYWIDKKYWGKG
ncbi:MAG: GNAT family N-acetyltransferase, partial [Pedobacter sp.]